MNTKKSYVCGKGSTGFEGKQINGEKLECVFSEVELFISRVWIIFRKTGEINQEIENCKKETSVCITMQATVK